MAILSRHENPVDATQFFSLTNQRSPLVGETSSATAQAKVEVGGAEFADLFKAQIQFQQRQEFAVPVEDHVELQVVPLGPTINLITANIPLPDMSSLASFARAQGLDEEAVKTLFGNSTAEVQRKPVELLQLPVLPTSVPPLDPMSLGIRPVPPAFSVVMKLSGQAIASVGSDEALVAVALKENSEKTVYPGAALIEQFQGVPVKAIVANFEVFSLVEKAPAANEVDVLHGSKVISYDISVLQGAAVGLTQPVQTLDRNQIVPITANGVSGESTEVLRIRLEAPSEAVTQKLSEISGSKDVSSWHALLASAALSKSEKTEIATRTELLSVDVPPGLLVDIEEDLRIDVPSPGSTPLLSALGDSTRIDSPAGGSGEMAQDTSAEHRSEQYQQLADRLGQAVAHKLLAQIERGEWKLQLRLQPESLGRVDVALEMHSGGLDALFTAENGVTRDLIAQGSAKLRDALTQSGMAVASVFVNSDQGRKSDGNPTSRQSFKGGSGTARGKEEESVAAVNVAKRQTYSVDGLDVLA